MQVDGGSTQAVINEAGTSCPIADCLLRESDPMKLFDLELTGKDDRMYRSKSISGSEAKSFIYEERYAD